VASTEGRLGLWQLGLESGLPKCHGVLQPLQITPQLSFVGILNRPLGELTQRSGILLDSAVVRVQGGDRGVSLKGAHTECSRKGEAADQLRSFGHVRYTDAAGKLGGGRWRGWRWRWRWRQRWWSGGSFFLLGLFLLGRSNCRIALGEPLTQLRQTFEPPRLRGGFRRRHRADVWLPRHTAADSAIDSA